jgi:hypothetical protein
MHQWERMGVKATICVLSFFLVAGTLLTPVASFSISKNQVLQTASDVSGDGILTNEDFTYKKASFESKIRLSSLTLIFFEALPPLIKMTPVFADTSVKLYLLIRALRN